MGNGRFVNQKLAKKRGFAERQAANRPPDRRAKQGAAQSAPRTIERRAIIGKCSGRKKA